MPVVTIPRRFNGPASSGNGGYSAGLLAQFIEGPAEVKLRVPPPLEQPLDISQSEGEWRMLDGETLVAEAEPTQVDIQVPEPVSFQEAKAATERYLGFEFHAAPRCFVCGPDRMDDGLKIFPGSTGSQVASPWVPAEEFAGPDGSIRLPIVWGALDCPGAFASQTADPEGMPYFPALGTMAAEIYEPIRPGQRLVVSSWHLRSEGRRLFTESAIHDESGQLMAVARHIEIKVPTDWAA